MVTLLELSRSSAISLADPEVVLRAGDGAGGILLHDLDPARQAVIGERAGGAAWVGDRNEPVEGVPSVGVAAFILGAIAVGVVGELGGGRATGHDLDALGGGRSGGGRGLGDDGDDVGPIRQRDIGGEVGAVGYRGRQGIDRDVGHRGRGVARDGLAGGAAEGGQLVEAVELATSSATQGCFRQAIARRIITVAVAADGGLGRGSFCTALVN